jgi:hypothetical protein
VRPHGRGGGSGSEQSDKHEPTNRRMFRHVNARFPNPSSLNQGEPHSVQWRHSEPSARSDYPKTSTRNKTLQFKDRTGPGALFGTSVVVTPGTARAREFVSRAAKLNNLPSVRPGAAAWLLSKAPRAASPSPGVTLSAPHRAAGNRAWNGPRREEL